MLLKESVEALQAGKVLCREAWSIEDGYLKLLPGMAHVWKIVLKPTPNAGNYIFSLEDLIASDWKEFELPTEACVEKVAEAA